MIIDFHTHTFPDRIANNALEVLREKSHTRTFAPGTLAGLSASMAASHVDAAVVMPVATNARQVVHVNDASIEINDRGDETGIYSFGCMYPDYEHPREEIGRLAKAGIKGIKLHPVYQGVDFDDPRYLRILDRAGELGLMVLIHAGWDIGFPGVCHASPQMILHAIRETGPLHLILAHMGGWRCWEEAKQLLAGTGVYIDTAVSLGRLTPNGDGHYHPDDLMMMDDAQFCDMVHAFGADHVLFGSDSPWNDQAEDLARIRALPLTEKEKRALLGDNAAELLGLKTD